MNKIKHIHFVGIKGVGMTPLAIIAKQAGIKVTGSDVVDSFITDISLQKEGIVPFVGFDPSHIQGADLIIASGAHDGTGNTEVKAAVDAGIRVLMQGQAVGEFMSGLLGKKFEGISVTGTHGKTTTTAMIATMLKNAGKDPSFVIGTGSVASLEAPGHFGKGKYFVAEADEYMTDPASDKTVKFLWQHPKIAVITNIEFDHPDVYSSIEDTRETFLKFANNLSSDGLVVVNGDDAQTAILLKEYKGKVVTFGFSPKNDFYIEKLSISGDRMFFWVSQRGASLGEFSIGVVGEHNAYNALSSIIVGLELGIPAEKIKSAISGFTGSKRRMEYLGKLSTGAMVYDDYAHHPTEIKTTLKTLKKMYPKEKIVCIFQPHTYSRTKSLFEQFSSSFMDANTIILTNIFASSRESRDDSVSSQHLAVQIAKVNHDVMFLPKLTDVVEYLLKIGYDRNTVIVSMGAGDIYKIWTNLL